MPHPGPRDPVDQLGLLILSDLLRTNEWNEYNYLLSAERSYRGDPVLAITEAMACCVREP